jgi:hypothetical protein
MEESTTYQVILRKGREQGRIEEARKMVLLVGEARFGPADAATRAAINAMSDLERLHELSARLATADSWADVVPRRRSGRRRARG